MRLVSVAHLPYYPCTMPSVSVLRLLWLYYACTMAALPALCPLCLYYSYYACTMPILCLCSVSRLALYRATTPKIFLSVFLIIFLFTYLRRLRTLFPPLCVILVFTECIRLLLLYCICLKSHTYIFFFFFAGIDDVYFFLLMVAR